ncbi:hypothetical protein [Pseudomonas gingeri]|uniref:Uncharacterized protein n=1 Tax=Pseudomonas gingeri TaxID=117681 RepID=A0A7Y7WMC1_9PSED|nr:hypothetical protein [Pseudomonas gingeri]NWB84089.1 hypothetical protein [Pseudomonas gingeri]
MKGLQHFYGLHRSADFYWPGYWSSAIDLISAFLEWIDASSELILDVSMCRMANNVASGLGLRSSL